MIAPTRIHPLTGEPIQSKSERARREFVDAMSKTLGDRRNDRRVKASYDAVREGDEFKNYWVNSDALDSDLSNSKPVRHKAMFRSRYEQGSNGYYAGILRTHCNMLVGIGPSLRMLTGSRNFNQLVEREFAKWAKSVQLRRKLWCMAHARTGDGESFAILQTNPAIPADQVQLDVEIIEAEQVQTPFVPYLIRGYIDGIRFDDHNNVLWYDVLPFHPGSQFGALSGLAQPIRVSPSDMVHWFKLERPGAHRGIPDLLSTLNTGAGSRRWREATLAAAETAADFSVLLKTAFPPDEMAAPSPFSSLDIQKRMMTALPDGWSAEQMKAEHPNATYSDFHRSQISEQARPISMPYNAAACDSSTYSFASGKLDTLCYRAALDVEREDCNDLVLDPIFAAWFREWTTVTRNRDIPPAHQWDWPKHPVIDAVQEETAVDIQLKNGTLSMRQANSDKGADYEDQLVIQAEDMFGDSSEESITKVRKINILRNTPSQSIQYVAELLGLSTQSAAQSPSPAVPIGGAP